MMRTKLWMIAAGLALPVAACTTPQDDGAAEPTTASDASTDASTDTSAEPTTGSAETSTGAQAGTSADTSTGGATGGSGGTGIPALVNVNLENVLNDLSVRLNIDRANIPVNAQVPIEVAANVCGVSVNVLSVSTGGQASCTATTGSPELAQVVQQQIAAGGSVGGGAQGGSTATTGGATGTGGSSTSGSTGTSATSSGTSETTTDDDPPDDPQ
jgi:hypothetical protein